VATKVNRMKAKELAKLLMQTPEAIVTFQHQSYLEEVTGVSVYQASETDKDLLWVNPPMTAGPVRRVVECVALHTFLDRQFQDKGKHFKRV
jgi:hypothetical protein